MHTEIVINKEYEGINPVQFGFETCEKSHGFGPATRTHWLLHFVVSGKGVFEIKGKRYALSRGMMFVIPPFTETYYEADSSKPWHYIWMGFTGNPPCKMDSAVLHVPELGDIFTDALQCGSMNRGKSAFLAGKIWQMFGYILDENRTEYDYVNQAIHCMKLEYANGISISEIADRLGLNRSYFSAVFKERTGLAPQDYLTELRIEKAVELMIKYKKSPSVAATSTGYSDIYNFSRMFKRRMGISPREFIKQQSNQM